MDAVRKGRLEPVPFFRPRRCRDFASFLSVRDRGDIKYDSQGKNSDGTHQGGRRAGCSPLGLESSDQKTRVRAGPPRSTPHHARTNISAAGIFSCADILRREASARVFWISKTIHSIRSVRRRTLQLISANGPSITPMAAYLDGLEEFRWAIVVITAIGHQDLSKRSTGSIHRINRRLDTPLLLRTCGY